MATIEDLNFTSITKESNDESIERLRQIRLNRRTPKKVIKKKIASRKTKPKDVIKHLSKNDIANLLKQLGDD